MAVVPPQTGGAGRGLGWPGAVCRLMPGSPWTGEDAGRDQQLSQGRRPSLEGTKALELRRRQPRSSLVPGRPPGASTGPSPHPGQDGRAHGRGL